MGRKRILVLGAYGMLGHKLFRELAEKFDVYGTCRKIIPELENTHQLATGRLISNCAAEDFDSIISAMASTQASVVVNCIGVIKHKEITGDSISSIRINALFPHKLASLCKASHARLIHFSTDCVFSGKKGRYAEGDLSDAEDLYGRTKFLGEVGGAGCLTIRSSLIGRELFDGRGLLEWFLTNRGSEIKGYTNAIFSGFTTTEMAKIVSVVIEKQETLHGVWHVASEPISKFHLLQKINRKFGLNIRIKPYEGFHCDRSLISRRFERETGYRPPSWDNMLDELSEEIITVQNS
jgi:dTDP-4-dehydrorhamnose reductase